MKTIASNRTEVHLFLDPLDSITAEDVRRLVDMDASETVAREFKSILSWGTPRARKDLVKHISAIANAGGGDIWFGIEAENGVAVDAMGIDVSDLDELQRGIESAVRDGTDPAIVGLRFHVIHGFPKGPVLVLRVPRTWTGPHMLTMDNSYRFHIRDTGSEHRMSTQELRLAFNRADAPEVLARQFRKERLTAIRNNQGAVSMITGPKLVVHALPLSVFDITDRLNITPMFRLPRIKQMLLNLGGPGRYNTDGYIVSRRRRAGEDFNHYLQVFRSGAFELVDAQAIPQRKDGCYIPYFAIESDFIGYVGQALMIFDIFGIELPYLLMLSLLDVKGYGCPESTAFLLDLAPIDTNDVVMPETVLTDHIEAPDLDYALCDSFDVMWNALGFAERMAAGPAGGLLPWRDCHPRDESQLEEVPSES